MFSFREIPPYGLREVKAKRKGQPGVGTYSLQGLRVSAVWQLLQSAVGTGSEVIVILLLAARLSSEDFGALTVALSLAKIVFLLFEPRIHEYLTPKLARYMESSARVTWGFVIWSRGVELRLNCVALTVCALSAEAFHAFSNRVDGKLLLVCGAYAFSNTLLKYSSLAILRCINRVRVSSTLTTASGLTKVLIAGLAAMFHWSPAGIVMLLCVPALCVAALQARISMSLLRLTLGAVPVAAAMCHSARRRSSEKRLLLSNYFTGLLEIGHREVDVQMVAWLAGVSEAGKYRVAKTLAMFTLEALNPVVLVLLPELTRQLVSPSRASMSAFVRRISRLFLVVGVASSVGVVCLTAVYVSWIAPAQAVAVVPTLILTGAFAALSPTMWAQAYLVAANAPQVYLRASLLGAIVAVLASLALVPLFGAVGAAISHSIGLGLVSVAALYAAREHVKTLRDPSP